MTRLSLSNVLTDTCPVFLSLRSSEARADIWDWREEEAGSSPSIPVWMCPFRSAQPLHFLPATFWAPPAPSCGGSWHGWAGISSFCLVQAQKAWLTFLICYFCLIIITLFAFIWLSSQAVASGAAGICRELNWTRCAWVFLGEPRPVQTSLSLT